MTTFNEEAEQALDEYVEETTEARREEAIIFYEGCTIVTAPTGPPPEYLTVEVDTINDPNVMWRGVPTMPAVGDEVIVWENPLSHRREIWGGSGTTGVSGGASWCQKVIVAKCGGDFTLPSAAITWINALAAGPLATRLFAINILGGNFAEAADVTVPSFVHVSGEGEGTEIEMGAFTLIMSANTSLQDVVVESSDPVDAIRVNGVANVILRNVSVIETSTGDCFHVLGASTDVYLYNCTANVPAAAVGFHIEDSAVAELYDCLVITTGAYNAATYGFEVEDTCSAIMSGCRAENDIFLADGLHMSTSTGLFCLTRYCIFSAHDDDILTQTNNLWYHQFCEFDPDNSTIAAGSHTALPTKRFNQTVVVAEAGGDFQALSEAVAWTNAQADAAAGKLYGILMLAGNFAEGGNVTIPQYVTVMGQGEGTEIEMGANSLLMSDDSSLQNVVVESSNASYAIGIVAKDNVILRNVHVVQTSGAGTPDCFSISAGSTNIYLYDCTGEVPQDGVGFHILGASTAILHTCTAIPTSAYSASTYGFQVGDTATVTMDYCNAEDGTDFADGLHLDNTALTCNTRWCTFEAADDDVMIAGTSPAWFHLACNFDPDNSTIPAGTHFALPTKRFNQTVIVAEYGGDFQALSEAITWINAQGDAAAANLYGVLMLAGNFAEAANVTIPSYVHVVGLGEGTEIEMGANRLIMGAYSSLAGAVVEGTGATHGHVIQLVGNYVVLYDVHIILTPSVATNDGLSCVSYYYHQLYHVTVETAGTADRGIAFDDVGATLLWDVRVDDRVGVMGNWTTALYLDDGTYACVVTTKYCEFSGLTDDVNVAATSEWRHFACQFDPDNCTIAGTETPLVTGKANFDDIVYFENGFTMDGPTTANIITMPTALAVGMTLVDTTPVEYLHVKTAAQLEMHFNAGLADVDHIFGAVGVADALVVRGSDGQITLGVLGAGLIETTAGGVLSSDYTINSTVTMASGQDIDPADASGQDLGDATHRWDLYTQEVYFGGATGTNIITVPDNVAQALNLVDAGGLEYMRIVSTNAQPAVVFNNGEADVDFRVAASGITNALFGRGSDGYIAFGHGTPIAPVDATWNFGVLPAGITAILNVSATGSGGAGAELLRAMRFYTIGTGAVQITELTAIFGDVQNLLTASSVVTMQGFTTQIILGDAGDCGTGYGYRAVPIINDTGSITARWVAFQARTPLRHWAATGTVATAIGLEIEAQNIAFVTTGYAIFQSGADDRNWLAGTVAIGRNATTAQLLVDQTAAGGAIPVLLLDQADLSEEFIEFTTTVGAGNPIDTAAHGAYYGKARVKVTGVAGYKVVALYEET